MPQKTPAFWYEKPGLLSTLLTPISWLYQTGHVINQNINPAPYKSTIPVICIGNAIAGGSGKTPTVIALHKLIKENQIAQNPAFLSRGYGGNIKSATIVDLNKHTIDDVGDEALLLATQGTTIVSPNRAEGAKLAESLKADLIIMDDGLLNKSLEKNITFLTIDRNMDFGNGRTIPAGPLREPLSKILPKTDAVICIGRPLQSDKPVIETELTPKTKLDASQKYIGFSGIAYPKKFKKTLEDNNITLENWYEFSDHHVFTPKELEKLTTEAQNKNATLITTEKDHVRLPAAYKDKIPSFSVEISIKSPETVSAFIKNRLQSA